MSAYAVFQLIPLAKTKLQSSRRPSTVVIVQIRMMRTLFLQLAVSQHSRVDVEKLVIRDIHAMQLPARPHIAAGVIEKHGSRQ